MIIPEQYHSSWNTFLDNEMIEHLLDIETKIGTNYNPTNPANILRFLNVDVNKIKVVWLGQDVYPAAGVATGRSFEVGNLTNWNQPFRQVSLKNIVRLVHKNYFGIEDYQKIKSYKEVIKDVNDGKFILKQPPQWFESLEKQGVLFLNTSLTCEVGKANSHKKIWEPFAQKLLQFISETNPKIIWFLWGNEARANKDYLNNGVIMKSRHPMMCSERYDNDFLKSDCFNKTWDSINWLG